MSSIQYAIPKLQITQNIIQSYIPIFNTSESVCEIVGIILTNSYNGDMDILTSIYLQRINDNIRSLLQTYRLKRYESVDIMSDKSLYLQPGDTLVASSDKDSRPFNTFVSYREFTETPI